MLVTNRIVLWDIDGTLGFTPKASEPSPHIEVIKKMFGDKIKSVQNDRGMTDFQLVFEILKHNRIQFSSDITDQLMKDLDLYCVKTPREFLPISNSIDVCLRLQEFEVIQGFQTGNTRSRAKEKIQKLGLSGMFHPALNFFGGLTRAKDLIEINSTLELFENHEVVIVGDSSADVNLAAKNGFKCLILTSKYAKKSKIGGDLPKERFATKTIDDFRIEDVLDLFN